MRARRLVLAFGLAAAVVAGIWMAYVDLTWHSCGFAFDWWNLPMCSYAAVARELITVDGAILGFTAFLYCLLEDER